MARMVHREIAKDPDRRESSENSLRWSRGCVRTARNPRPASRHRSSRDIGRSLHRRHRAVPMEGEFPDTTDRLLRARNFLRNTDSPRHGKSFYRRSSNAAGRKDYPCRNACSSCSEQPVLQCRYRLIPRFLHWNLRRLAILRRIDGVGNAKKGARRGCAKKMPTLSRSVLREEGRSVSSAVPHA